MKLIQITLLLFLPLGLFAQKGSSNKTPNYFIVNAEYLYRPWQGQKFSEDHRNKPSSSGSPLYSYVSSTAKNTSGFLLSLSYRQYWTDHFSMQYGVDYRYSVESFLHHDSLTNGTMSPVIRRDYQINTFEASTYLGFHSERWTVLTGIISPIVSKPVSVNHYNTGERKREVLGSFSEPQFFFSEKLQYMILKDPAILLTVGADFAPGWIYGKMKKDSGRGYQISLNAGVTWMLENTRSKKKKK